MTNPSAYAVLGSTGNCGTALIENLLKKPDAIVHAYCRNSPKLLRLIPGIQETKRVRIFEGSIHDVDLLKSCVCDCQAIFLVVSTNDNIPGCRLGQDTASVLIDILQSLRGKDVRKAIPKIVLLSSSTIDDLFSRHQPALLRRILLRSASHVYRDLEETEKLLRANEDWLTTIYVKPGALSVDIQRGHSVSLTNQDGPLSYLDLAAGMIEAADDEEGRYDLKNVSIVNTNGKAKFPAGTPMCVLTGLLRHYFPFLHPYLPMNTGPR
jgi:hypothetical protein